MNFSWIKANGSQTKALESLALIKASKSEIGKYLLVFWKLDCMNIWTDIGSSKNLEMIYNLAVQTLKIG